VTRIFMMTVLRFLLEIAVPDGIVCRRLKPARLNCVAYPGLTPQAKPIPPLCG
jgi:hypothetical protein